MLWLQLLGWLTNHAQTIMREVFPKVFQLSRGCLTARSGRNKQHYFGEILFIAVAAVICQCEGFDDMKRFAQTKEAWLRKYLKLPNGLPSDDTFRRVFTAIEPKAFHACFMTFTKDLLGESFSKLIAIDGKARCFIALTGPLILLTFISSVPLLANKVSV